MKRKDWNHYKKQEAKQLSTYAKPLQPKRKHTLTELYGWYAGVATKEPLVECQLCGAAISDLDKHQDWHNQ